MKTRLLLTWLAVASLFVVAWPLARGSATALATTATYTRVGGMKDVASARASWRVVRSPSPGTNENLLNGVAAVSANDVWAVGCLYNTSEYSQALIEHWNGARWAVVPSPYGMYGHALNGVAAVSANDVWGVGTYENINGAPTLIEHWNGTQWNVVPSPSPGAEGNNLNGVAAVSANDVWAVGSYAKGIQGPNQTLVEHWNGTRWTVIPSPNGSPSYNQLNGVAAVSTNNVWTVGTFEDANDVSQTLIEHWNGTAWKVVPSPNPGAKGNYLNGVAAVSPTGVWAVGDFLDAHYAEQTLIEQWNGTSWSVDASSSPGGSENVLNGVAAMSASDAWAVGYFQTHAVLQTLIERWNGTTWTVVFSPNPDQYDNELNGVAAVSANNVWTAGSYGSLHTLSEQYAKGR